MDLFSIKNKVVVVTGATGMIGRALVKGLMASECQIVALARNQEKISALLDEFSSDNLMGLSCDVTSETDLKSALDQILSKHGKVDALINAAGGNVPGATQLPNQPIFEISTDAIKEVMDLNLMGTVIPSKIFGEAMAEKNSGSIVNITSMANYQALSRVMGYSMAKSGVDMFTKWFACELARKFGDQLRVNAIAPGFFIGNQNRKLLLNDDDSLTERSEKVIAHTPMGRFGDVNELVGATQFLISEASSFITGIVIPVDGGFRAFSGV